MPRRPRSQLPQQGVYHVTARGVARTTIFRDDDEHGFFLRLLADVVERFDWHCYVFCLMPNHYHVVVATQLWRLSTGAQRLNGVYAQAFNNRHKRSGHLFGDRFASWVVESEEHLHHACEYVLQNPVRAGLCEQARDWRWSGSKRTLVRTPDRG